MRQEDRTAVTMHEKESGQGLDGTYLLMPKQRRQAATRRSSAKFEEIREQLRALALELGPGSKLPPIRELCTLLNTSSATLTSALDLLETEHILYRKERQGIFVAEAIEQRVIHILFNVAGLTEGGISPFWALLLGQMVKEVERRSSFRQLTYQFHFINQPFGLTMPKAYAELFHSPQVSGCLIVGMNARETGEEESRLLRMPHVVYAGGGDIILGLDAVTSAQLAMQSLLQQKCKRIGYWLHALTLPTGMHAVSEFPEGSPLPDEVNACRQILESHGNVFYPEFFCQPSSPPSTDERQLTLQEQGYLLTKEIFGPFNKNRPDGVYIANDMMTSGALVAWDELGVHVGEDIKVASHAVTGSPMLFGKTRHLITIETEPSEIVRMMFSLLDVEISQGYVPGTHVYHLQPRVRVPQL